MRKYLLILAIVFARSTLTVLAQSGNIRGFVYNKKTGEPIMYTNVILKGTTFGAPTDDNGYFTITRLVEGSYTVMATGIGYDTAYAKVELRKMGSKVLNYT